MAEIATGNREDALDIVQDTMFSIASRYSQSPEHEWPALFHRVLQNRINDWYRKHYRKKGVFAWFARDEDGEEETLLPDYPEREGDEPDRKVQAGKTLDALEQALLKLPLRQKQVVMLRIWEGFDEATTASVMGCSAGSVKTHFSRALHRLREQLGEHWP